MAHQDQRSSLFLYVFALVAFSAMGCSDGTQAPQDCTLSEWSEWSTCSELCDGGEQARSRGILTSASNGGAECSATDEVRECNADPCVRLNHIQVVGSHNSYKIQPSASLQRGIVGLSSLAATDLPDPRGLVYGHSPLAEQFANERVRHIELDIWIDDEGGRFADPFGPLLLDFLHATYPGNPLLDFGVSGESFDPDGAMRAPGFKVFHVQDIDFRTTCFLLEDCLQAVEDRLSSQSNHLPIMVLLELKQDAFDPELLSLFNSLPVPPPPGLAVFTEPTPWDLEDLLEVEDLIRTVFADQQIIMPNEVRAGYPRLQDGIAAEGWPTLADSRGRVMFTLDNEGALSTEYANYYDGNLDGALIFTSSDPSDPERADVGFVKRNDPFVESPSISELVALNYMVRTRADSENVEADLNNTARRDAALGSGAQWVSTDYQEATNEFTDYQVILPDGAVARCNPVSAPVSCEPQDVLE